MSWHPGPIDQNQLEVDSKASTWNTGDIDNSIDWGAPIPEDGDYDTEIEASTPPNRATYQLADSSGWRVKVEPYNRAWPQTFLQIKSQLQQILTSTHPPVEYNAIEHIGSTSIPGLCAKPNIDILITLPSQAALDAALEALLWEIPTSPPFISYTRIADGGGIQGRESLKLYASPWSPYYITTPERSVYLINEDETNPRGRVQVRCYRSVRRVLCDPANDDLKEEYARVKQALAQRTFPNSIDYSVLKNDVIREILRRDSWTDAEIDEKELLSHRIAREDDDPPY